MCLFSIVHISKIMISSNFNVLPSSADLLDAGTSSLHLFLEPIASPESSASFEQPFTQIPKCPHCSAFLNARCDLGDDSWVCSVCRGAVHHVKPVPHSAIACDVIDSAPAENSNTFDCTLAVMVNDDLNVVPVREIVTVFAERMKMGDMFTFYYKTEDYFSIECGDSVEAELDDIEINNKKTTFKSVLKKVKEIIKELNTFAWCTIVLPAPSESDDVDSLINVLKKRHKQTRIDLYFVCADLSFKFESEILPKLQDATPGIIRTFRVCDDLPVMKKYILDDFLNDFAFDVYVEPKNNENDYKVEYSPHRYLSEKTFDSVVYLPVLPAEHVALGFVITPPDEQYEYDSKTFQFVIKYIKWNAKTHQFTNNLRIVNQKFDITSSKKEFFKNLAHPMTVYSWARKAQELPLNKVRDFVIEKIKNCQSMILENIEFIPLITFSFSLLHNSLSKGTVWSRINSNTTFFISSPKIFSIILNYSIEAWSDQNTLLKVYSNLRADEIDKKYIYVIKSCPLIQILSNEGSDFIQEGTEMDASIKKYIEDCKPFKVSVSFNDLRETSLLQIYIEEGLYNFLTQTGLESLSSHFGFNQTTN